MNPTFRTVSTYFMLALAMGLPSVASADDELRDAVTAYLKAGDSPKSAVVELWMSNTNDVLAVSLPFKFAAGDSLLFDSVVTAGGRASQFAVVKPVFRPENQTLLVNLMWAKDTSYKAPPIPPGTGPLLQVYLRTPGSFPMKEFRMVNVQLPPENVLMFVTSTLNSVTPAFELSREAPPSEWGVTAGKDKQSQPK